MKNPLLEIVNLKIYFFTHNGIIKAVNNVSLTISAGEAVGIVGESGCGKSVLARSIMRLIPDPPGRIVGGEINFSGENLLDLSEKRMQGIRGNAISMIFQEPMTSLNPVYTVGDQLAEIFGKHQKISKRKIMRQVVKMLRLVGIPSPENRVTEYPFQMSGGMRQRVVIAMALACQPKLVLADEPTTALDVTIQAQILRLLSELREELNTAIILITHDLGVIAETVEHVLVMYAGKVMEQGSVQDIFENPLHPYTEGLMWSVPSLEKDENKNTEPLKEIPGIVPDLSRLPSGCYFYPRCHKRMTGCHEKPPKLMEYRPSHFVRCWLYA